MTPQGRTITGQMKVDAAKKALASQERVIKLNRDQRAAILDAKKPQAKRA